MGFEYTSRPELQIEIERLASALRDMSVGDTVSYARLKQVVGCDYKPWSLIKARHIVEDETGFRLSTVHGVGVKKLSGADVVGIGKEARSRIGKIARRQSRRLTGLNYNDVSPEQQRTIDMERSLLGAISAVASGSSATVVSHAESTGPQAAKAVLKMIAES
jgi:hypothetical protein